MQEPNRSERSSVRNDHASVDRTYIRPAAKGHNAPAKRGDSFQKVLVLLTTLLTVSLVVLLAVLAVGRYRTKLLEDEIASVEAHNSEAQEKLDAINAVATALEPVEEPDVYAAYTRDSRLLTGIRSEYAILIDVDKNEVIAHKTAT